MKAFFLFIGCCLLTGHLSAQSLFVSGPMCGYTELRTSRIWAELQPSVTSVRLTYRPENAGKVAEKTEIYKGPFGKPFHTIQLPLTGLEPGTRYQYELTAATANGTSQQQQGHFTTQTLWQYRSPAPDFSFLTGSCAYINQKMYDRPGAPYGGDTSIFSTMAHQPADFMLWLGDNWYTREADYMSTWGLHYRPHHDRSLPVLQPLLKAMPHYATWDDHDYGPNDFGFSYIFKEESRQVFMDYWANPTYGEKGQGIYTQFMHNDVAFFLLDDRTWRNNDAWRDSVNGAPDTGKRMFGKQQMHWLKDALLSQRNAPFKIIATGSQVLNPVSPYDCFRHYEAEFNELMDFITAYDIPGVVFLTGDRHRSEIIRMDRPGNYPLYDITASPLTSHVYGPGGAETDMKERVPNTLVVAQNYAKISITGAKEARTLQVQFFDIAGIEKAQWQVSENELRRKKP